MTDLKPIWKWFNDSTDITVIWGNQPHEQPDLPYAALEVLSETKIGALDERRYTQGDTLDLEIVGQRELVISVHVYSEYRDSRSILNRSLTLLDHPKIRESLCQAGIGVLSVDPMLNNNLQQADGWVYHSSADVTFSIPISIEYNSDGEGYFTSTEITGDLDGHIINEVIP